MKEYNFIREDDRYWHNKYGMGTIQDNGNGVLYINFQDGNYSSHGIDMECNEQWILENCKPVTKEEYAAWSEKLPDIGICYTASDFD